MISIAANESFKINSNNFTISARSALAPAILLGYEYCDRFCISYEGDILISGRICASGHVLLQGSFCDPNGKLVLSIYKEGMKIKSNPAISLIV